MSEPHREALHATRQRDLTLGLHDEVNVGRGGLGARREAESLIRQRPRRAWAQKESPPPTWIPEAAGVEGEARGFVHVHGEAPLDEGVAEVVTKVRLEGDLCALSPSSVSTQKSPRPDADQRRRGRPETDAGRERDLDLRVAILVVTRGK